MRLLDITLQTDDEEYSPETRICCDVERRLQATRLDTYNKVYVVRVTVDEVDEPLENAPEDDED